jgi:hypothetical protein
MCHLVFTQLYQRLAKDHTMCEIGTSGALSRLSPLVTVEMP